MGVTTLGAERATQPVPRRARRPVSRLTAPRGTFDILPDQDVERRAALEAAARELLEAAGYGRIETPAFEATELFARGVGEATDIVQKEMYSFDDGGGRSLTLRPEGTAPVCRAYVEHGMHKLAAPVKLYYLSSFFRAERPQAGRYRQFWQVGAEALGSDDPEIDAETDRAARDAARARSASSGAAAAAREPRQPADARRVPRGAGRLPARPRRPSSRRSCASASSSTRCARSTPTTRRRGAVMARRAAAARPPRRPTTPSTSRQVRELLDVAGVAYELDPTLVRGLDYYTRTLFEFTSDALGAQSGVGGGGRYDGLVEQLGGPPTPGIGWAAGVERILLACGRAQHARRWRSTSIVAHDDARADAFATWRLDARAAGLRGAARARRPLAEGPAQARRSARRALRRDRRARRGGRACATCAPGAERDAAARRRSLDPAAGSARDAARPRPTRYRDAGAASCAPRDAGDERPRRRLGAPPPRPRRPDLHRPARPLRAPPARLPSRHRAGGARRRARAAQRGRDQRRAARSSRATPANVNPNLADRRDRARRSASIELLATLADAAVPDRRGRSASTRRCACATARSTCAASRCATR